MYLFWPSNDLMMDGPYNEIICAKLLMLMEDLAEVI